MRGEHRSAFPPKQLPLLPVEVLEIPAGNQSFPITLDTQHQRLDIAEIGMHFVRCASFGQRVRQWNPFMDNAIDIPPQRDVAIPEACRAIDRLGRDVNNADSFEGDGGVKFHWQTPIVERESVRRSASLGAGVPRFNCVHTTILVLTTDKSCRCNCQVSAGSSKCATQSRLAVHDYCMATSEDKLAQCAAYYRRLLDGLPQSPESLSQAPDSRLHVIIERAGAKRRSEELLRRIEEAFSAEGMRTFPALTDPDLASDDRVFVLDAKRPIEGLAPRRQLFRDEKTLQEFVSTHLDWFRDLRRLKLCDFDEQAVLDSGRRVDILCKRRGSNQLVGIELKVREPDDRAVGQLQQYLDDLRSHATNHGFDSAHLIVISGQPDKSVRERVDAYAESHGAEVTFLLYRVQLELVEHP